MLNGGVFLSNVPNYKEFLVPFLIHLADGNYHTINSIIDELADHFNLSETDKSERVRCGRQFKYRNRIISARTCLLKTGYVEYIADNNIIITEKGITYLKMATKLKKTPRRQPISRFNCFCSPNDTELLSVRITSNIVEY
ncbi:winged helix-turn-helix domain-containing protein [Paenibacillus contaminans]|uniref:winged helix-turn-helix domain-containing protein n=1 Tax=Paenibacillus contaminans TaxID=450362 RepID=UPI003B50643A